MKTVYLAGPFRAPTYYEQEQNVRRAEALALEVWKAGFACLCPHTNTRFFQGAAPDEVWLVGDLALMVQCDAVLMTLDWQRSVGATAEHEYAQNHEMPVFYELEALKAWSQTQNSR